jgi:hypothetical protein
MLQKTRFHEPGQADRKGFEANLSAFQHLRADSQTTILLTGAPVPFNFRKTAIRSLGERSVWVHASNCTTYSKKAARPIKPLGLTIRTIAIKT